MRSFGLPEMLVITGVFILVPVVALIVVYLVRKIEASERLRAIEKGVPVPGLPSSDPWERAARTRKAGILWTAMGLGLGIFLGVMMDSTSIWGQSGPKLGVAFSAIPVLVGVGHLVEYRLRVRELRERSTPRA